jgi:Heterokaryon incompatibility protein (HET)
MKLINVNTYELLDTNFTPGDPTNEPYAILSHTWREDEVTYADMKTLLCRQKRGWKKIEYTCALAKRHELEWAWVDTCCIDKSSSAELSEAINSMFRWYEEAKICFVYLDDFEDLPSLKDCRWFERGWTLQELLAPREVHFYDRMWTFIDTKESLVDQIADRTLIDVHTLSGRKPLSSSSIARRMSWASYRKTTRIEDRAYCLLGIFGVHMPLLYGEGTRAFVRLQEEIMKISDDQSIFAWGVRRQLLDHWDLAYSGKHSCGPLSPDPEEFRRSGDISCVASLGHYSMTNQGLEVTIPLMRAGEFGTFGLLGCKLTDEEDKFVAMHLLAPGPIYSNSKRYTRQRFSGASTFILPFKDCLDLTKETIVISGPSGITGQFDGFNHSRGLVLHQWLRLNTSAEFERAVMMICDSEVDYRTPTRQLLSNTFWWSFEPDGIPSRVVFLVRLRESGTLVWVFLRDGMWTFLHRDASQMPSSKSISQIATERSLDVFSFFDRMGLDTFTNVSLEPDNKLIRVSSRSESVYNHSYHQVDLTYQEPTVPEIAKYHAQDLVAGSEDHGFRQRIFDSCCSDRDAQKGITPDSCKD